MLETIKTRKSIRTFDGRIIAEEDLAKLKTYAAQIRNPYGIPVEFVWLDAEEHGLSSPVINGEHLYVAGKIPKGKHCEEAFGYSFESLVLYAWSLGIGTTWVGGSMDRALFEKAAQTGENEIMMIVSPLGYPASDRTEVDQKLRDATHGDERLPISELFFEGDFSVPMTEDSDVLEAVRWAPSAANMQPWRVVRVGNSWHFYEKHTAGYRAKVFWDVQRIDIGIAICHFMSTSGGKLSVADPGIVYSGDTEYIATVTLDRQER